MRNSFRFLAIALLLATGFAQAQWTWTPQTGRFVNLKRMPKETPELQLEYARSLKITDRYMVTEEFIDWNTAPEPTSVVSLFSRMMSAL